MLRLKVLFTRLSRKSCFAGFSGRVKELSVHIAPACATCRRMFSSSSAVSKTRAEADDMVILGGGNLTGRRLFLKDGCSELDNAVCVWLAVRLRLRLRFGCGFICCELEVWR